MAPEQDGIYGGNGHNVARAAGEVNTRPFFLKFSC